MSLKKASGKFFEVSPIEEHSWAGSRLVCVGTEHHLTIAQYIFDFLVGEFRRSWNRRQNKRLKRRKAFIYGAYVALYQKLESRFKQPAQMELALEVSLKSKRDAYIAEHFGALESSSVAPKQSKGSATFQGYNAGRNIEIRPGVTGNGVHDRPGISGGHSNLALEWQKDTQ